MKTKHAKKNVQHQIQLKNLVLVNFLFRDQIFDNLEFINIAIHHKISTKH